MSAQLIAVGVFALVGLITWAAAVVIQRRAQRLLSQAREITAKAEQSAKPTPANPGGAPWHSLPGNTVIELGTTGFAIHLVATKETFVYRLFSPEGMQLCEHVDLLMLKAAAERFANEREQFTFKAPAKPEGPPNDRIGQSKA